MIGNTAVRIVDPSGAIRAIVTEDVNGRGWRAWLFPPTGVCLATMRHLGIRRCQGEAIDLAIDIASFEMAVEQGLVTPATLSSDAVWHGPGPGPREWAGLRAIRP